MVAGRDGFGLRLRVQDFAVFALLLTGLFSAFVADASPQDGALTDEFVVEVPRGEGVARRLAARHGLIFEGRVSEALGEFFSLRHAASKRRAKRSVETHLANLENEDEVTWVERQVLLTRNKRGFGDERREDALEETELREEETLERNKGRDFEREAFEIGHNLAQNRNPEDFYRVKKTEMRETKREMHDCMNFNDPHWKDQWYLCNSGQTGGEVSFDLNVGPAWKQGFKGKGVVTCILDDGVDHTHPDIKANFDWDASWDANGKRKKFKKNDPEPRTEDPSNNHGTKCAGEIVMIANNGECGVGVAPEAKVGGVRMLDGPITDRLEAQAIGFKNNYIDVYSASWGPKDNGKTMEAPGHLTQAAFVKASKEGRNGKGSIFVWASGNGGMRGDDCGADGYVSSIYTISIGSINEHGLSTYFMEFCPSTMAVVFSGGMHDVNSPRWSNGKPRIKVVTTDIFNQCTENFQGTSAAAPLGTGCAALTLQANPNLGWRDVQHIIVHSTRIPNPKENGWEINGAGHHINDKFGFGVLDCSRMVQNALNWTNVPEQHVCETQLEKPNLTIPKHGAVNASLYTDGCEGNSKTQIDNLEHVQLYIKIKHPRRGNLRIRLFSPDATMSEMISLRKKDDTPDIHFTFMTVRNWGENPRGKWTVEVYSSSDAKPDPGVLEEFRLVLYGYANPPKAKSKKDAEAFAVEPSAQELKMLFKDELRSSENLQIQLRRVARVLKQFGKEDRDAILALMEPSKRTLIEKELHLSEKREELEAAAITDLDRRGEADDDIDILQGLIQLLETEKK